MSYVEPVCLHVKAMTNDRWPCSRILFIDILFSNIYAAWSLNSLRHIPLASVYSYRINCKHAKLTAKTCGSYVCRRRAHCTEFPRRSTKACCEHQLLREGGPVLVFHQAKKVAGLWSLCLLAANRPPERKKPTMEKSLRYDEGRQENVRESYEGRESAKW